MVVELIWSSLARKDLLDIYILDREGSGRATFCESCQSAIASA